MKKQAKIVSRSKNDLEYRLAFWILVFFVTLSLLAPIIANKDPIYLNDGSKSYWPALKEVNWEFFCKENCKKVFPLIQYSPETLDKSAISVPPFSGSTAYGNMHWLGTDNLGRDILSGVIHGSKTALWVSVPAVLIAFTFGLIYGMMVGYYEEKSTVLRIGGILFFLLTTLLFVLVLNYFGNLFYISILSRLGMLIGAIVFVYIQNKLFPLFNRYGISFKSKPWRLGMRMIDLIKSLPPLFVVLYILQVYTSFGIGLIIVVISFLVWTSFARHARAESLRVRNLNSVKAAILSGRSDLWIIWNELLPKIIRPLFVIAAFAMSSAILLEATLSFLGLGLPVEHVSWGTMINDARNQSNSIWLLLFPGLCLIALLWSFQTLGRWLEEQWQTQQKFITQ